MLRYLHLHGVVGTAWFALVVVQPVLIANRRFTRHRQLGLVGVGLAVVIIGLGVYTSTHMVPRNAAAHEISDADIQLYGVVTAADLAGFIVFPALVALAIYFRRRVDIHIRLMLIATSRSSRDHSRPGVLPRRQRRLPVERRWPGDRGL